MLLLDTCALLWLAADHTKLSDVAKQAIEENSQGLFVSSISAFEIAVKAGRGRLSLPMPALEWFDGVIEFHGVRELPVTSSIAIHSVNLPALHNDPCDRIIIATAEANGMCIVTSDGLIKQYTMARVVW